MIAPASGRLLSSAKATVISSASDATCTWQITGPSWLAKAATTCPPSMPACPAGALPRRRLPSIATVPSGLDPCAQAPNRTLAPRRPTPVRSRPRRGPCRSKGFEEVVLRGGAGPPLEAEQERRRGRQPASPAEDRAQVVAAGQHSGQRQRQDRAQGIAASFGSAPVRDVAQCFPQGPARTELSCIAHNHPPAASLACGVG